MTICQDFLLTSLMVHGCHGFIHTCACTCTCMHMCIHAHVQCQRSKRIQLASYNPIPPPLARLSTNMEILCNMSDKQYTDSWISGDFR